MSGRKVGVANIFKVFNLCALWTDLSPYASFLFHCFSSFAFPLFFFFPTSLGLGPTPFKSTKLVIIHNMGLGVRSGQETYISPLPWSFSSL